jgi:hypothetical protein
MLKKPSKIEVTRFKRGLILRLDRAWSRGLRKWGHEESYGQVDRLSGSVTLADYQAFLEGPKNKKWNFIR